MCVLVDDCFMGAPHMLRSAAHPTKARSSRMWRHWKGKETGSPTVYDANNKEIIYQLPYLLC